MNLDKFVHTTTGKYIISILLGFGLATFFRKICIGKSCIIEKAPSLNEIDNQIYNFNNKCYKLTKQHVECSKNKKTLTFA
jgi:hypothetical protein